jgi:hypothetical protein
MMEKLNKISEKNPFKVPENYFEEVNRKIISATSLLAEEPVKRSIQNRFRPYLLIAASVTGFIVLSYTAVKLFKNDNPYKHLSEAVLNEYTQSYLTEFDIPVLETHIASMSLPEDVPQVDKSEIIDYLLLENIEIGDIYE